MKVSSERVENCQVVLNIEVETEEVERSLEEAYRRLVRKTNIPGFRKGRAPRAMLERHLGRDALFEDAMEHLIPEAYARAIQEEGIDAIVRPQIELTQSDPVVFRATVAVRPTVELGDYHHLRLEPDVADVGEGEVEAALEQARGQFAIWEPVEREVALGDLATIDVEGSIDGEPFSSQRGIQYNVAPNSGAPVPGFADQLLGMGRGEEKEFTISVPRELDTGDISTSEYFFKVRVSEVKQRRLPEPDDEFAKAVGFESIELLRRRIFDNLKAMADERGRRRFEERLVDEVVELAEVEFPPILVEQEIDRITAEMEGSTNPEDYLRMVKKTEEELGEELRPMATRRVTTSLVLGKVADEEGLRVSDDEIDAEIELMARGVGERGEEVRRLLDSSRRSLEQMLLSRKALERLTEIALGKASELEEGGEKDEYTA